MEIFPTNSVELDASQVGELFSPPLIMAYRSMREQSWILLGMYIFVYFFSIEPAALCFKSMALLWGWSWTSEISGTLPYEASVVYRSSLSSTSAFRVFGMYLIWSVIAPSSYLYSRVSWGGMGVLEKVFSVCSSLLIQLVVHIYFHLFLVTIL